MYLLCYRPGMALSTKHRLRCLTLGLLLAPIGVAAQTHTLLDNLDQTLAQQRRLLEADPESSPLWNDLGNLLLLDRREADAETAFDNLSVESFD